MTEPRDEEAIDLSALPAAEPPPGFADRVMGHIAAEPTPLRRTSRARWSGGGAAAIAIAAAIVLGVRARGVPSAGEATADERVEVAVGGRAKAVLEPGARVSWNGDRVVQARGDVFYRVEPGATFRVATPAGDVEVRGTCFAVKVRDGEAMQKREMKAGAAGAVGAALSAMAFVAVYEGKVAASHGAESVEVRAGESATLSGGRAAASGGVAEGEKAFAAAASAEPDAPLAKANENLAAQVGEYRKRLELVAAKRAELEAQLAKAEEKLASSHDGAAPRTRNEFDLDKSDWAELAKTGEVKYRTPCLRSEGFSPSREQLDKLGLAPQDGETLKQAYSRAYQRAWSQIAPLCQAALGSPMSVVEKIGPQTCAHLIVDIAQKNDPAGTVAAQKAVGEIRAGLRPEPPNGEGLHPVTKMFLALTGAQPAFESDLAQTFGPEEAHRIAYAEGLCAGTSHWGSRK